MIEALHSVNAFSSIVVNNPVAMLYGAAAIAYFGAAVLSGHGSHRGICACYTVNAFVHGMLGMCHVLHLG